MKYLVILLLLGVVALLLYLRLRPYLRAVRRLLGVVREVNRMRANTPGANTPSGAPPRRETRERAPAGKLVRCAACGAWTPADRAVTLRATGVSYCSHACLERSADSPRHKAVGGRQ